MQSRPSDELQELIDFEKKNCAITHLLNDIQKRFVNTSDYYTVLGVKKTSTSAEIKHAFENMLKIYNADTFTYLFGNRDNVSEDMKIFIKILHAAYDTLGNTTNKYFYDNKDIIQNTKNPDDLINQFVDGLITDFDPTDKASYWTKSELN